MSKRTQILDSVETLLKAISVANGYNLNFKGVYRFQQRGQDVGAGYPYISLLMSGGDYRQTANAWHDEDLSIEVGVHLNQNTGVVTGTTDAYIDKAVTDVIRAVLSDPDHGGVAIDTIIDGWRRFLEDDEIPEAGAVISFRIPYTHAWGDPR
jgi:hypothetical protein